MKPIELALPLLSILPADVVILGIVVPSWGRW